MCKSVQSRRTVTLRSIREMNSENEENDGSENCKKFRRRLAVANANLIVFFHGCNVGWVSPNLESFRSLDSPSGEVFVEQDISWIASVYCLGFCIGIILLKNLSIKFGRRTILLLSSVPFMFSWTIIIWARSAPALIVARFFAGTGGAGAIFVVPFYCHEIFYGDCLSKWTSIAFLAKNLGILFSYVAGVIIPFKWLAWILLTVPVVFFVTFVWMPESPVYFLTESRDRDAIEVIAWLNNSTYSRRSAGKLLSNYRNEDSNGVRLRNRLFNDTSPLSNNIKAICGTFIILAIQSFIGMFAILNYAFDIFKMSNGYLSNSASSIVSAGFLVIGSMFSTFIIPRMKVKLLFVMSLVITKIGVFFFGLFFFMRTTSSTATTTTSDFFSSYECIPLISWALCTFAYATGIEQLSYLMASDILFTRVRNNAEVFLLTIVSLQTFMITKYFYALKDTIRIYYIFWTISGICCMGILLVTLFVPAEITREERSNTVRAQNANEARDTNLNMENFNII